MTKFLAHLFIAFTLFSGGVASAQQVTYPHKKITAVDFKPSLYLDFVANRDVLNQTDAASALTVTRASTSYGRTSGGALVPFTSNTPVITDRGLQVEESRTNVVLHNRDLTNAAWSSVSNITAAKDQTGADGTANAASSILATADNATILQPVTLASSARSQSAFVKRITGSGAVYMTLDGGTTWTAVTVTSAYTLVTVPTQTLANPSVGFKIATSGDKIAVDMVQNENGSYSTSPIPTTSGSATRAADVITVNNFGTWFNSAAGTVFIDYTIPSFSGSNHFLYDITDTTISNEIATYINSATGSFQNSISNASVNQGNVFSTSDFSVAGGGYKLAFAFTTNDMRAFHSGLSIGVPDTSVALPTVSKMRLGARENSTFYSNSIIRQIAVFNRAMTDNELIAITR